MRGRWMLPGTWPLVLGLLVSCAHSRAGDLNTTTGPELAGEKQAAPPERDAPGTLDRGGERELEAPAAVAQQKESLCSAQIETTREKIAEVFALLNQTLADQEETIVLNMVDVTNRECDLTASDQGFTVDIIQRLRLRAEGEGEVKMDYADLSFCHRLTEVAGGWQAEACHNQHALDAYNSESVQQAVNQAVPAAARVTVQIQ